MIIGIIIIFQQKTTLNGAKIGFEICCNNLIPFLFPMVAFSSFVINSDISYVIDKFFGPTFKFLFFIPYSATSVLILSLFGGYQIGARGIRDLLDKNLIDERSAQKLLLFCVNAGFMFVICTIENRYLAYQIWISQTIASLIIAVFIGIESRKSKENFYFKFKKKKYLLVVH
ncbi:MAG: hypothetical protein FWC41_11845 [Firmicutes bacterium]|nr:hypothetical protein [Bacillota bacterium]